MKKLMVLFAALLVLGAAVVPAAAVPTADLTALADVFPAETSIFFALRTDDGYIDTLDGVLGRVNSVLPFPMIPALRGLLDDASGALGGDFNTVFRSWLGDTAAIGVDIRYVLDADPENDYLAALLAIETTDSAAAESFWTMVMSEQGSIEEMYTVEQRDGMTIYRPNTDGPQLDGTIPLAFAEGYMLFGNLDISIGAETTLAGEAAFADAMGALPNGDYNIGVYLDNSALFEANMAMMTDMGDMMNMGGMMDLFGALIENAGSTALGFTVIEERSLTIDFAITTDLAAIAETIGIDPALMSATPIDPAFARFIPAGTPVVSHVTNLAGAYTAFIEGLRSGIALGAETSGADADEAMAEIDSAIAGIEFAVRGATGLDLNDDILSWMTGDLALWVGIAPAVNDATSLFGALASGLPVDFGILIDSSADPDSAAATVEGLRSALEFAISQLPEEGSTQIELTNDVIGGSEVVVLTVLDRSLPFPIELVIGADANVFVLGTRAAAEAALNPVNGLDADPAFQEALAYALPNTVQVHYLSGTPFLPLLALVAEEGGGSDDVEMAAALVGLVSSSSITSVMTDGGYSVGRLVLTLAE